MRCRLASRGRRRYSEAEKERAVRAVRQLRKELGSDRGGHRLIGLVTHSVAGSQFTSVRFTERLDEIRARPSIVTVADSYDNALAETANGLYKAECVYGPDPNGWDDVVDLELATLSWVRWLNHDRLRSYCDGVPPRSSKQRSMLHNRPPQPGLETNKPSLHQSQGGSEPQKSGQTWRSPS